MSVHIVNAFVKFINNNLEYLVASFFGTVLQNVCNNKMDYFKKTPLSMSLSIEFFVNDSNVTLFIDKYKMIVSMVFIL